MHYKAEILTSGKIELLGVYKTRGEAIRALLDAEKTVTSDNYQAISSPCESDGTEIAVEIG